MFYCFVTLLLLFLTEGRAVYFSILLQIFGIMKTHICVLAALAFLLAGCNAPAVPENNNNQNNNNNNNHNGNPGNGNENSGNENQGNQGETPDFSDEAWYSTNFWERTDREKEGLRGPVKKWRLTNYIPYDEYEYDTAGHLIKESHVDEREPEENSEWRYTYDSKGRCIKRVYYDSYYTEGGDYYEFEYNNEGKYVAGDSFFGGPSFAGYVNGIIKDLSLIRYVMVQPDRKSFRETKYTFGEDGNLNVEEYSYIIMLGSEEKQYEESYSYTWVYEGGYPKSMDTDKLRFKVLNITYYPNGMYKDFVYKEENAYNYDTGWDTHTYKMLDNPRYLTVETFELGGTPSTISLTPGRMLKTYDEHFDIVKNQEWYTDDATPTYTDTWTNYTYDKYGNWITRKETVIARWTGDEASTTVEREIEYY